MVVYSSTMRVCFVGQPHTRRRRWRDDDGTKNATHRRRHRSRRSTSGLRQSYVNARRGRRIVRREKGDGGAGAEADVAAGVEDGLRRVGTSRA